jgi:hypothetical protein
MPLVPRSLGLHDGYHLLLGILGDCIVSWSLMPGLGD